MYKSMTPKERCEFFCQNEHWLPKDVAMCINCKYFHRHYALGPSKCTTHCLPLNLGHCEYPRIKGRKTYDTCEYFVQKGENT